MFDLFFNKNYLLILILAVVLFLQLYFNPVVFQNKNYLHSGGDSCPNPSWHAFVFLIIASLLYFFMNKYQCSFI
jgi:hypothetical protein